MRIFESLPRVASPGPNILNSVLVVPSLVTLPPLNLILPCKKSVFNWLLEGQENKRVGDRCELDYVAVTAHSPLHRITSQ